MTQYTPTSTPQDPAISRTSASYYTLVHRLTAALPPPSDDTPVALVRRNLAAVAEVAALLPTNPAETALAVAHVAANAHAMECLRLAHHRDTPRREAIACGMQSASMLRQALAALRALQRMQAVRAKRETQIAPTEAAERLEHIVASAMTDALDGRLDRLDPPPPIPEPEADPPATEPVAETGGDPGDQSEMDAAVAQYVHIYPQRAALIRRHGGVPANVNFGPPDDSIVRALVGGHSPLLRALDRLIPPAGL